ncbi:MAG: hypothetical protein KJ077_13600 [Anaerolineae bacterium]|nr:hypothetical protein [Anaerolineae bacterium]
MPERPVIEKIEKLLRVIKQYNVENNPSPEALFRPIRLGFSLFCTFKDLPAKYAKRRRAFSFGGREYQKLDRLIVGHCHWLLSENQQDLIGVTLRTDIEPSEGIGYGDKKAQLRRLEVQNRPEDISWATEKIEWLWYKALPSEPLPQIMLAEKIKLLDWDEYVDHGDYLPEKS